MVTRYLRKASNIKRYENYKRIKRKQMGKNNKRRRNSE